MREYVENIPSRCRESTLKGDKRAALLPSASLTSPTFFDLLVIRFTMEASIINEIKNFRYQTQLILPSTLPEISAPLSLLFFHPLSMGIKG